MDVVLIALYAFWNLEINGLYVEFGAGKNKHWISVHDIAADLGEEGHYSGMPSLDATQFHNFREKGKQLVERCGINFLR